MIFQLTFLLVLRTSLVLCVSHELLYPYGTSRDDYSLSVGDDISSEEIQLETPIGFYDRTYRSIFVNLNGHLSFETEVPLYQHTLTIPTGRFRLISAFLSDIDTRGAGTVFYRETDDSELLARADSDIHLHFSEGQDFRARHLFIATWDSVGYYDKKTDMVNTFQIVIASDGSQSFTYFLYRDHGLQWITSDGKSSHIALDPPGQAGFDSGYPDLAYKLKYSGTSLATNLEFESNIDTPGMWMFYIGQNIKTIQPADLNTGDEITFNFGDTDTCLTSAKTCHSRAECMDFPTGICCACLPPTFGNGLSCLERVTPQRLNGKVSGNVNGVELNQLDMHTYIVTKDGRAYTAISRIPQEIGQIMTTLNTIGGIMGWLFAVSINDDSKNGYMFTGGKFNRTAVVTYASGESITLEQVFFGHDTHQNIRLSTTIIGTVPPIGTNSKVTVDDYKEEYRRVAPGEIKSFSTRIYRVDDIAYRYTWDQSINFEECEHDIEPIAETSQLSVTRNFVVYDNNDNAVRYAQNARIQALRDVDPCQAGLQGCDSNAECVPIGGGQFKCECRAGYVGDGYICEDIDECQAGVHTCDVNARCFNAPGSFQCQCLPGYLGDGRSCVRDRRTCGDKECSEHGRCVFNSDIGQVMCECGPGYYGDGITCQPVEFGCDEVGGCSEYAACNYDEVLEQYRCECNEGFSGDGQSCTQEEMYGCQLCDSNSECYYDPRVMNYRCRCHAGYTGDGQTCTFIEQTFTECDSCDQNAECYPDQESRTYRCRCKEGFYGDGYRCEAQDCRIEGYCDRNARCVYYEENESYRCNCNPGFTGDGRTCSVQGCDVANICDVNARCLADPRDSSRFLCQCLPGYEGDGRQCRMKVISCKEVNNCHEFAQCVYNPEAMSHRCRCRAGYEGDGTYCRPKSDNCKYYPQLCDPNAMCVLGGDDYVCFCEEGYRGNGSVCDPVSQEGDYLIYAQGMSIMRVPFKSTPGDHGNRIMNLPGRLAVAVAVDCYDRFFYWTDALFGTISRARLDGTDIERLYSGLGSPEGIAIDWMARNMYFTDSKTDTVSVATLDGEYSKVLFNTDMREPRAIVADPARGMIYWTDWNRNKPQIEKSYMDGTHRSVFVDSGLGLPNGLTMDIPSQTLCWGDAGDNIKRIECIRSDGSGRRVLSDQAQYPFGITFLGNSIFWTDWVERDGIQSVYISGGAKNEAIPLPIGGRGKLYGMASVTDQCPPVSSPCTAQNGGCSYICLPTPRGGRTCACPSGMSDEECQDSMYIQDRHSPDDTEITVEEIAEF